jgi:hypothetical protein
MFNLDRYFQIRTETHITVDEVACAVSIETRPSVSVNWRNIKQDICAVGRNVWGWVKDAVAIDELMGVAA